MIKSLKSPQIQQRSKIWNRLKIHIRIVLPDNFTHGPKSEAGAKKTEDGKVNVQYHANMIICNQIIAEEVGRTEHI